MNVHGHSSCSWDFMVKSMDFHGSPSTIINVHGCVWVMRSVRLLVYYQYVPPEDSKWNSPKDRRETLPMSSGWHPWAAGEYSPFSSNYCCQSIIMLFTIYMHLLVCNNFKLFAPIELYSSWLIVWKSN